MAKIQWTKALEDYAIQINRLSLRSPNICSKAVYEMANIVANEIKEQLNSLPAEPDPEGLKAWKEGRKAKLTVGEKKALIDGFGISPMQRDDGFYNVKVGFDGYDNVETQSYPNGRPIVMIARAVESGSSVREKTPFVRPAVNRARKNAIDACDRIINEEMKKQST